MNHNHLIIALDGTAASGKGTLGRALARRLNLAYLDTGKLYRLIGLGVLHRGGDPADAVQAEAVADGLMADPAGADLSDPNLTGDAAGQAASKVAAHPGVRAKLVDFQRKFALNPPPLPDGRTADGAVLDGRDIGTVICPDAPVKFFVTATIETRAARRHKELQSTGISVTYEAVLAEMRARDARDSGRETAPMKPAADALILDTTFMDADQVLDAALSYIRNRL